MKKIVLSVSAVVVMNNLVFVSGDIVEPVVKELSGFCAAFGITAVRHEGQIFL